MIELNQDLSLLEQPEAEFEPKQMRQVITIASCDKIDVAVLFNQRPAGCSSGDQDANMSDAGLPELPRDFHDEVFDDVVDGGIEDADAAEAPAEGSEGAAPPDAEPSRGHIVVDGVELHEAATLRHSVLRAKP